MSRSDDNAWAMTAHLLGIVLSIFGPLGVLLFKGKESRFVKDQSLEALNFQITLLVAWAVCLLLSLIPFGDLVAIPVAVAALVLPILAGIGAHDGRAHRYPVTLRLVR